MNLFFNRTNFEELRFSLEQLLRMLAGAIELGGVRLVKATMESDPTIISLKSESRPRGMEFSFELIPPFQDFTGFVEVPNEGQSNVHLSGFKKFQEFHAHLTGPKSPVFVSAERSPFGKPTPAAKKLANAFLTAGAKDIGLE